MANKPVIKDIKIDKETLAYLESKLKSTLYCKTERQIVKKYIGGLCCVCGEIPVKSVKYKMEDITRVERYCLKCFDRWVAEEK